MNKTALLGGALMVFVLAGSLFAGEEFISYKLDGKAVLPAKVRLVWHADNYIDVEGVQKERVDLGPNAFPRYREAEAGISFQISPEDGSFVGTHKGRSSDTLPVYANWYDIVKEGNSVEIIAHQADMDGDGGELQYFAVIIENFGEEGTLVKGTFSGRLSDAAGVLHPIEEGRFALRRKDESS